jgi:hypothetical protein
LGPDNYYNYDLDNCQDPISFKSVDVDVVMVMVVALKPCYARLPSSKDYQRTEKLGLDYISF